jgi:hypothetical protein
VRSQATSARKEAPVGEETIVTQRIYQALVAVGGELAKVGISKSRQNEQQHFRFRGIDDVMNVVSPILSRNNVLMLVDYTDYPDVERVTGKGATLIYSKVKGTFTFTSAEDGSQVSVTTFGVAMDSGDKSVNKAMSAALKYALLQTFLIPTESSEDADSTTPEPSMVKPPAGYEEWFAEILAVADQGFEAIRVAWRDSPEPFRQYTLDYRKGAWDAAKAHATEVTTAAKKAAQKPVAVK